MYSTVLLMIISCSFQSLDNIAVVRDYNIEEIVQIMKQNAGYVVFFPFFLETGGFPVAQTGGSGLCVDE